MTSEVTLKDVITFIVGAWPRPEITPESIQAYKVSLEDEEPEPLMQAVKRLARTSQWRPTIKEILDEVKPVEADPETRNYWAAMSVFNAALRGDLPKDAPYEMRGARSFFVAPVSMEEPI